MVQKKNLLSLYGSTPPTQGQIPTDSFPRISCERGRNFRKHAMASELDRLSLVTAELCKHNREVLSIPGVGSRMGSCSTVFGISNTEADITPSNKGINQRRALGSASAGG